MPKDSQNICDELKSTVVCRVDILQITIDQYVQTGKYYTITQKIVPTSTLKDHSSSNQSKKSGVKYDKISVAPARTMPSTLSKAIARNA